MDREAWRAAVHGVVWSHKELDTTEWLKWTEHIKDFPGGLDGEESACNAGDLGSIPGSGRSPEQGKKPGLKLTFRKMKIMASGPVTSWQINGETTETETDFIFLGSKITVDGDCNHEIKRHLVLERKAMTNLGSILKNRHYFANKGLSSQSYGFSSSLLGASL